MSCQSTPIRDCHPIFFGGFAISLLVTYPISVAKTMESSWSTLLDKCRGKLAIAIPASFWGAGGVTVKRVFAVKLLEYIRWMKYFNGIFLSDALLLIRTVSFNVHPHKKRSSIWLRWTNSANIRPNETYFVTIHAPFHVRWNCGEWHSFSWQCPEDPTVS